MSRIHFPTDEKERLKALHRYNILDTPSEAAFDRITALAARLFRVPIALISFVDEEHVWYKSCYGLEVKQADRASTLCNETLNVAEGLIIPDLQRDPRFADRPVVTGRIKARFYAGVPLYNQEGYKLGTICILDYQPRQFTADELLDLQNLAAMVIDELELRLSHFNLQQTVAAELERKQAEHALKQSEANLRAIFDSSRHAFQLLDQNRKLIAFSKAANEATRRVWGRELKEGDSFYDFVSQADLASFDKNFDTALHGGSVSIEKMIRGNAATDNWFEFFYNPVFGSDQKVTGVCISVTDITERKIAEQALMTSEERFRTLVQNSSDIITVLEPDGIIRYQSPSMERILGYGSPHLLDKNAFSYVHPEDLPNVRQAFISAMKQAGVGTPVQFRFKHANGNWIYLEAIGNNLLDDPVIKGVVINSRDITERKQAEVALRQSESKYRTLLEQASDGIFVSDIMGHYIEVNPRGCEMLGYSREEILQMSVQDVILQDAADILESYKALRSGKTLFKEFQAHHKEGWFFPVEATVKLLEDGRIQAIVRDVTEKRRIAEELANSSRLEGVGILAGGIAHDFNNILAAIIGNLSLSKMFADPSDEIFSWLDETEKAALRAKDLTQQLLIFSKGGAPVKKTALLPDIIRDSAQFSRRGSNVNCQFEVAADLWPVEVDVGQLSQVIQNLVINAVQAMPHGGTLQINAENLHLKQGEVLPLAAGRYVKITVQDEGTGISKENLAKIFDAYFTTKEKGNGLGLAISFLIIKKHDGLITVASEVGKGTTFSIYLPASEAIFTSPPEVKPQLLKGSGRILLMDDEPALRDMAGVVLKKLGYEVKTVKNGQEAIEQFAAAQTNGKPFDVVVMDLTIPAGMGGKEAISHLKALDKKVKAIVSSGYSNDPVMANFREYGFSGVVSKPYTVAELGKILQEVLLIGDRG